MRAAIYARVSTAGQTTENQVHALQETAKRRGWDVTGVYVDHGISGSKGRDQRPEFDKLLKAATRREVDVVMAWSVDRLGRSLQDLVGFLSELRAVGADLYLHQQGIDTSTPAGKAMFQMIGTFAEFERSMIQERIHAGLERARRQGKVLGRPRAGKARTDAIRALRADGLGMKRIARELGCGVSLVQRVVRESADVL